MKIDVTSVMPTCQHLLQSTTLLQLMCRKVVYGRYPRPSLLLPLLHLLRLRRSRQIRKSPPPPTPPLPSPTSEEEGTFSSDLAVSDPTPPHRCDVSDAELPAAITVGASQCSVRSNLSDAYPATPHTPLYLLTPENMGLPLTPLCRIMGMPNEAISEEVYDSDMQFVPFIQDVVV